MKYENNFVRILWTGGWDSTYRVLELSRQKTIIQPIYISGDGRASEKIELEAIGKISTMIRELKETKAELLPIQVIDKSEIPENPAITKAFNMIHERTHLGSQHEWLARYANLYPGLELGTEAGEPSTSHIIDAIEQFGKLKQVGDTYILDDDGSTEEGMLVLGNFSFPIIDKYETDMKNSLHNWGGVYESIMKHIWFCHNPIDGKPCGLCHPCAVKMESNMQFLLPETAQKRYFIQKRIGKIIGGYYSERICNKIFRAK